MQHLATGEEQPADLRYQKKKLLFFPDSCSKEAQKAGKQSFSLHTHIPHLLSYIWSNLSLITEDEGEHNQSYKETKPEVVIRL